MLQGLCQAEGLAAFGKDPHTRIERRGVRRAGGQSNHDLPRRDGHAHRRFRMPPHRKPNQQFPRQAVAKEQDHSPSPRPSREREPVRFISFAGRGASKEEKVPIGKERLRSRACWRGGDVRGCIRFVSLHTVVFHGKYMRCRS
jgi:hypothetical protein